MAGSGWEESDHRACTSLLAFLFLKCARVCTRVDFACQALTGEKVSGMCTGTHKPPKRYYVSAPVPYKLHRQIVGLARKYKKDKAFMVRELLRLGISLRY